VTTLSRGTDSLRLERAVRDAVWNLEHDYQIAALAVLRNALSQLPQRAEQQDR
jgi:hypothetical protein